MAPILAAFVCLVPSEQIELVSPAHNIMERLRKIRMSSETAVNACCKAMVEFEGPILQDGVSTTTHNLKAICQLRYIHRTVAEVLEKPNTQRRLIESAFPDVDSVRSAVRYGHLNLLKALVAVWQHHGGAYGPEYGNQFFFTDRESY